MTRFASGSMIALVAALGACTRPVDIPPPAARAALLSADRAFNQATAERRMDGWVAFFAENGSMFRPGGLATGPAAIRERMGATFADTSFTLTWDPTQADASGDLGYTVGRYESRRRDEQGKVLSGRGSYLTVWKRQADGTWKIVFDIGNPDGPMQ